MKLEQICVSLELSKKLEKAGYPQESLFRWVKLEAGWRLFSIWEWENETGYSWEDLTDDRLDYEWYSAPTASELGEALSGFIINDDVHLTLVIQKINIGTKKTFPDFGKWGITYCFLPTFTHILHSEIDEKLVEALAKMWLYLKDKGLLCIQRNLEKKQSVNVDSNTKLE